MPSERPGRFPGLSLFWKIGFGSFDSDGRRGRKISGPQMTDIKEVVRRIECVKMGDTKFSEPYPILDRAAGEKGSA